MKKLLLFSALFSLTVFAACNKQDAEDDFSPAPQGDFVANHSTGHEPGGMGGGCGNTSNELIASFVLDLPNGTINENATLPIVNKSLNASYFEWNFGNGDFSSQETPSYAYPRCGSYKITLKVTDNRGNVQYASKEVTVACL